MAVFMGRGSILRCQFVLLPFLLLCSVYSVASPHHWSIGRQRESTHGTVSEFFHCLCCHEVAPIAVVIGRGRSMSGLGPGNEAISILVQLEVVVIEVDEEVLVVEIWIHWWHKLARECTYSKMYPYIQTDRQAYRHGWHTACLNGLAQARFSYSCRYLTFFSSEV